MTDISVQNIKISFEQGTEILSGVTFDVTEGEHIGILGKNGAGKTTLFRIITGEISADSGIVVTAPEKRVGVLSQIPLYPEAFTGEDVLRTAHERVYAIGKHMRKLEKQMEEGDHKKETLSEYDKLSADFLRLGGYELGRLRDLVSNGLGIPKVQREQLFSELSGGERTRLNLARLILEDTDILLLDEPTNHLDMRATEWLEEYISKFRGTVLSISHDRYYLDRTVTRIVEILDGKAEFYSGNYSFYVEEKGRRYEERMRRYEKEQAKISQLQKAAEDLHLWAFMGNDKLHKRAFSIEKRIEKMSSTDKPKNQAKVRARFGETGFKGDEVLTVKGLEKSFGGKKLFSDVEIMVTPGERIALIGDNGTGKSTLIKIITGEEPTDTGYACLGPAIRTGYLPQIITFDDPRLNVLETMMYKTKCSMQEARDRLGAYLFRGDDVYTTVSKLSGGEKSRLAMCMLMRQDISLLILDEPTNHLDVASREWIEEALSEYGETLLFVSHDRYFINRFATRIWELRDGKLYDYRCGFERYRTLCELEMNEAKSTQEINEKPKKQVAKNKKNSPLNREKRIAKLEKEIAALEEKVAAVEIKAEEFSADYEKLMELENEKSQLIKDLDEKYSEWEALSEQ